MHATFEKVLKTLQTGLEALESRITGPNASTAAAAMTVTNGSGNLSGEAALPSTNSSFATQTSDEKPSGSKELTERRAEYGLVYIMHMRFARRAEGLQSSRTIFGKARRDKWISWQVYEAAGQNASFPSPSFMKLTDEAALMEYHVTKATGVASRIFEKGLEIFGDEVDYVLRYLGFLISVNDNNSSFNVSMFDYG